MPNQQYADFIASKRKSIKPSGIDVDIKSLNKFLKPFQSFCVWVALKMGRFCLFEDCGLGKTIQQLSWAHAVAVNSQKPVLILAPNAVCEQTILEGEKFGIDVYNYDFECPPCINEPDIFIINYEQLHNIDTDLFSAIVLDESSILKNHEGAYRNLIMDKFQYTPYKLACTATPGPNDPMELGNHSEFLGIMSRNEMLATYFVHDGGETSKWRLKGHSIEPFWRFINSFSLMFSKPSEIGFSDDGYLLPPLNYIERKIETELREGKLINDVAVSALNFNSELRITKLPRMEAAVSIINSNINDSFIIWIKHNAEGEYLRKSIPEAIEVQGSDTDEYKKEMLIGFGQGKFRVLITKTKIAAMGMNYQNCHNQIFASPDFSFEQLYQGIRRSYRFGQLHPVNIYLIITDTMRNVIAALNQKEADHLNMQRQMSRYTKDIYRKYLKKFEGDYKGKVQ